MAYNTTPPVTTKEIDFAALVRKVEGDAMNKPETVYEFSNGREFKDSGSNGGIYNPS
jgi:hypothetical protein